MLKSREFCTIEATETLICKYQGGTDIFNACCTIENVMCSLTGITTAGVEIALDGFEYLRQAETLMAAIQHVSFEVEGLVHD